ncbi:hypothetical protein HYH03_010679 [Edaphochlamys debaryana]|uniref:Ankyrin repeat domain-containing protein n=1 Tax=Edaphochlamys debaryana TaxID=47281 RepID=A0A836BWI3_9CHLO|nr:hypothetical protein HYH03_010679 [Edaphochlamys debaryana]|eukprot:KAG2491007.1 hypothetical protein HYH03_010679 [Edaphochlamys debaryana]
MVRAGCSGLRWGGIREGAQCAAEGGQLGIMEWLLEKNPDMLREHMLMCAAWEGLDLPTARRLRWQHCQRNRRVEDEWDEDDLHNALVGALGDPTPQWRSKVEWLLEQGAQVPQDDNDNEGGKAYDSSEGGWYVTLPFRAVQGRFPGESICERFEWLKSKGHPVDCSCGGEPLAYAIIGGYTATVAWLLEHGATPAAAHARMEDLLPGQLEDKHLGVLQALKAAGCLELRDFVHGAAAGGAMAVVEWAGEEWDWAEDGVLTPALFTSGAKSGSVEVMRWLLQRGCPMSEGAWSKAAESGCEAAVELLAELGCPIPADSQGIFTRAVERGAPIATLEWLLAQGCRADWGKARATVGKHDEFLEPFEDSKVNVLAWLSRKQREEDERARQQRT